MRISFSRSEESLLDLVRNGDRKTMESLYAKHREPFLQWSYNHFKVSREDAMDHYQETMTILFEKVMNGSIVQVESSFRTLIFGIGKNKILQQFDREKRQLVHESSISEHYNFLLQSNDELGAFERARDLTKKIFSEVGEPCKELLTHFYFDKKSMTEIANLLGHKTEAVTRTTKKRCMEKIRNSIVNS